MKQSLKKKYIKRKTKTKPKYIRKYKTKKKSRTSKKKAKIVKKVKKKQMKKRKYNCKKKAIKKTYNKKHIRFPKTLKKKRKGGMKRVGDGDDGADDADDDNSEVKIKIFSYNDEMIYNNTNIYFTLSGDSLKMNSTNLKVQGGKGKGQGGGVILNNFFRRKTYKERFKDTYEKINNINTEIDSKEAKKKEEENAWNKQKAKHKSKIQKRTTILGKDRKRKEKSEAEQEYNIKVKQIEEDISKLKKIKIKEENNINNYLNQVYNKVLKKKNTVEKYEVINIYDNDKIKKIKELIADIILYSWNGRGISLPLIFLKEINASSDDEIENFMNETIEIVKKTKENISNKISYPTENQIEQIKEAIEKVIKLSIIIKQNTKNINDDMNNNYDKYQKIYNNLKELSNNEEDILIKLLYYSLIAFFLMKIINLLDETKKNTKIKMNSVDGKEKSGVDDATKPVGADAAVVDGGEEKSDDVDDDVDDDDDTDDDVDATAESSLATGITSNDGDIKKICQLSKKYKNNVVIVLSSKNGNETVCCFSIPKKEDEENKIQMTVRSNWDKEKSSSSKSKTSGDGEEEDDDDEFFSAEEEEEDEEEEKIEVKTDEQKDQVVGMVHKALNEDTKKKYEIDNINFENYVKKRIEQNKKNGEIPEIDILTFASEIDNGTIEEEIKKEKGGEEGDGKGGEEGDGGEGEVKEEEQEEQEEEQEEEGGGEEADKKDDATVEEEK